MVGAKAVKPASSCESEVGPTRRRCIEGGNLSRDLDRVHGEGIETGRPERNGAGHSRQGEQGDECRLKEQIVEDADDVEAALLDHDPESFELRRGLVALKADPESLRRS